MESLPEKDGDRIESLICDAQQALDGLMTPEENSDIPSRFEDTGADPIEIELGRIPFGAQERLSVRGGTILPLGRPVTPEVTLWRRNRKIADGVLLVKNGRLAVRITAVEEANG